MNVFCITYSLKTYDIIYHSIRLNELNLMVILNAQSNKTNLNDSKKIGNNVIHFSSKLDLINLNASK